MARIRPLIGGLLLAGAAAGSGAAAGCGAGPEPVEVHYPSMAEVRSADGGAQSWVPAWIPDQATGIAIKYDLDTNARILRFDLGGAALPPGACTPGEPAAGSPELHADWFPHHPGGEQHLTCDAAATAVVVAGDTAYAWSPGDPEE
ncbi:hypothetical protein IQ251_10135 [Saccharopolyspora sp. HNM0983]|uniref:YbbD head domain-containing protein n=1 Tax=Saccharopolyspora montiporae TaxID=2781240 RepID=A0A929B7R6_9PSEU|nr:hypothetical protein [Saccharopolyspora sp. HNM0983]MBE9374804.1 hypothetical protein [Saccharopolyspora sp. HNM0983]